MLDNRNSSTFMALRTLISEQQIQARIAEIGAQIDLDYPEGTLYLVCILKGACFFLADLARAVKRDLRDATQVDLISAYFAPNPGMLRRLDRAGMRGQVRIVLVLNKIDLVPKEVRRTARTRPRPGVRPGRIGWQPRGAGRL